MDTICINCPMGCNLHIDLIDNKIVVSGNTCNKGKLYGEEEFSHPKRTITALIHSSNGVLYSCKTSGPVGKEVMISTSNYIRNLILDGSYETGDIAISNLLNLGVDLVITGRK